MTRGRSSAISYISGDVYTHAFLYINGGMQDLGTLGGLESEALGMNSNGDIVGDSLIHGTGTHAFLYSSGSMVDLNSLLDASSQGTLFEYAMAINDSGLIVGNGTTPLSGGNRHPLLLTPVSANITLPGSYSLIVGTQTSGSLYSIQFNDSWYLNVRSRNHDLALLEGSYSSSTQRGFANDEPGELPVHFYRSCELDQPLAEHLALQLQHQLLRNAQHNCRSPRQRPNRDRNANRRSHAFRQSIDGRSAGEGQFQSHRPHVCPAVVRKPWCCELDHSIGNRGFRLIMTMHAQPIISGGFSGAGRDIRMFHQNLYSGRFGNSILQAGRSGPIFRFYVFRTTRG